MNWQTVFGDVPSKSNSYKIGVKRLYKTKEIISYEKNFVLQMGSYRGKKYKYFELHVKVFYSSWMPDMDNATKVIFDSLQAGEAIQNDRYCCAFDFKRRIDEDNPRIEFAITELMDYSKIPKRLHKKIIEAVNEKDYQLLLIIHNEYKLTNFNYNCCELDGMLKHYQNGIDVGAIKID